VRGLRYAAAAQGIRRFWRRAEEGTELAALVRRLKSKNRYSMFDPIAPSSWFGWVRLFETNRSQHGAVEKGLACQVMTQIGHGHSSDLVEGFLGQKGLMGGDEHIRKAQQAAQFIVRQQPVF